MPKKHNRVKVVKIPLRKTPTNIPQVFPRMPRLYLELFENKAKIKQDLINKEYVPVMETEQNENKDIENYEFQHTKHHNISKNKDSSIHNQTEYDGKSKSKKSKSENFETRLDRLLSDDSDSDISLPSPKGGEPHEDSLNNLTPGTLTPASDLSIQEKHNDDNSNYSSDDSEELANRLKELLNDDSDSDVSNDKFEKSITHSVRSRSSRSDKYSRYRDVNGHSVKPDVYGTAPTLAELEQRGGYVPKRELRDINQTTISEQQEEDLKREILFKFDLLRKSYSSVNIPEYNIHTDYRTMQKSYDDTVRRLSLDSSVENYKTYLVYGFMGCEFIFGNFLGFDMQGFTQQQLLSMNSYEKLLIEIGEKSYVPSGSKWPVELRLLFMIIMNAAFFVVSKMIMKKTGANLMGMINNMNTTTSQPTVSTSSNQRKRRMRGPNIDLGDIPDIDSPNTKIPQGV